MAELGKSPETEKARCAAPAVAEAERQRQGTGGSGGQLEIDGVVGDGGAMVGVGAEGGGAAGDGEQTDGGVAGVDMVDQVAQNTARLDAMVHAAAGRVNPDGASYARALTCANGRIR